MNFKEQINQHFLEKKIYKPYLKILKAETQTRSWAAIRMIQKRARPAPVDCIM